MAVPAPCGRVDGPIGAAGSEDAGDADVEVRGEDNTGVEVDGSACVRSVAGSVDSHSALIASNMASTIAQSAFAHIDCHVIQRFCPVSIRLVLSSERQQDRFLGSCGRQS